jgi:hypothetical protein
MTNQPVDKSKCEEIWIDAPNGQSLCALINGSLGWLMYLRGEGDAGFSSRNPTYDGPPSATIGFYLNNGQIDTYPAAWALPVEQIRRALSYFEQEHKPPPFVHWHNDSDDGTVIPFIDS